VQSSRSVCVRKFPCDFEIPKGPLIGRMERIIHSNTSGELRPYTLARGSCTSGTRNYKDQDPDRDPRRDLSHAKRTQNKVKPPDATGATGLLLSQEGVLSASLLNQPATPARTKTPTEA